VSNGWITLLRPPATTLPGAEATMSTVPQAAQASTAPNSTTIVMPMARPIGEGGDSTISRAAGRKANSCRFRPFAWRKGMTTSPGFAGTEESADFMEASLQPMQRRIAAAGLDQRIMGAVLDQAAALQGEDPIRRPHGGEPVRNDK